MADTDFVGRLAYRHPDHGDDDPRPDPFIHADFHLTRQIAEVVEQHYFGHPFRVVVDHRQGIVKVQLPHLMPAICWYVVHISDLNSDPGFKQIVRACGDILERYKLPRAAYDRQDFIAAVHSVPIIQRVSGSGHVPD